ncbi:MAG TPA: methyltransferase domain-containing protein [Polyangiaceae bacterium]|nr:methyltransferase domain-containing protein [Polyangiaceae bacterium]
MTEYSDQRYLHAKRTVDDRALNRGVLDELEASLAEVDGQPVRILELGAGVGTMLSRLGDWGVLQRADYVLLDRDATSLGSAREHLEGWADSSSWSDGGLDLRKAELEARAWFIADEAFAFMAAPEHRQRFDVVVANAVLDLMDLEPVLRAIWSVLKPGGRFWFSINFDADTIFEPELPLDERVMRLYHQSMDERVRDGRPAGHSKTGRRLLTAIGATGAELRAAGSSDWVVFPRAGRYSGDEAYFLRHIVHTIEVALTGHPELESVELAAWLRERFGQIERGELCYIAHQLDVFGVVPRDGTA